MLRQMQQAISELNGRLALQEGAAGAVADLQQQVRILRETAGGQTSSSGQPPQPAQAAGSHQPNGAGGPAAGFGLRVNDMIKGLNRITVFSGDSKEFVEWEYAFTSYIRLYSEELYVLMLSNQGKVTAVDEDLELEDEERRMSAVLHHVLVMVLKKHPLQLVRAAGPGRGIEGWRSIRCHYRPRDALRHVSMLQGILEPQWSGGEATFGERILDWERAIAEYEGESGVVLDDTVKAAVMVKYAPASIKEHIHMSGLSRRSYRELRHGIDAYLLARRVWTKEGTTRRDRGPVDTEGDVSMVDALFGKGYGKPKGKGAKGKDAPKGKGKGKGKSTPKGKADGKGTVSSKGSYPREEKGAKGSWQGAEGSAKGNRFEGYCSACWKWGHKARDCWQGKGAKVNALQVDEPESEQKPVGAIASAPGYRDAQRAMGLCMCAGSRSSRGETDSAGDARTPERQQEQSGALGTVRAQGHGGALWAVRLAGCFGNLRAVRPARGPGICPAVRPGGPRKGTGAVRPRSRCCRKE